MGGERGGGKESSILPFAISVPTRLGVDNVEAGLPGKVFEVL